MAARNQLWDGLDAMISDLTAGSLGSQRTVSPGQKKFLADLLPLYRKLATKADGDEKARAKAARAARQVAKIETTLGRLTEAAAAGQLAADMFAKLAADFPGVPEYPLQRVICLRELGNSLFDLGKRDERIRLLKNSVAELSKLIDDRPGLGDHLVELADAHNSLGLALLEWKADYKSAAEDFRTAIALFERLAADHPEVAGYRSGLANSCSNLGLVLDDTRRYADAEKQYRRAIQIRERLIADHPTETKYQHMQAHTLNNLGLTLWFSGQSAAGVEQLRKALTIREKMAGEYPSVPEYRLMLARAQINLANKWTDRDTALEAFLGYRLALSILIKLLIEHPDPSEHQIEFNRAREAHWVFVSGVKALKVEWDREHRVAATRLEKLAAAYPEAPWTQVELGVVYCHLGRYSSRVMNTPVDGLKWADQAVQTLSTALKRSPSQWMITTCLRDAYVERIHSLALLGKDAEQVDDYTKLIELSPPASRSAYCAGRIKSLIRSGRTDEAEKEQATLGPEDRAKWTPIHWYNFACAYSVASAKWSDKNREYTDRAMELLKQAVEKGYTNHAHMKQDADLDPLRERDDFKKLLADLEKKFPPKKEVLPPPRKE